MVMLSMDGFRPEYFHRREATAALRCVAQAGVKAPFMQPAYPTLTFPNHYTLVTGLYPESHGIVNNAFHDPHLDANFSTAYANVVDGAWWRRGEALWVTTRRQGMFGLKMKKNILEYYFYSHTPIVLNETGMKLLLHFFQGVSQGEWVSLNQLGTVKFQREIQLNEDREEI